MLLGGLKVDYGAPCESIWRWSKLEKKIGIEFLSNILKDVKIVVDAQIFKDTQYRDLLTKSGHLKLSRNICPYPENSWFRGQ